MNRRLTAYLFQAVLLLGLCLPIAAAPGLVDWAATQDAPTPQDALRHIAGQPGCVEVRWRAVGAEAWEGCVNAWRADGSPVGPEAGAGLLKPSLKVAAFHGSLRLALTLTAARAAEQPTEVLLRCPFEPAAWQRQFIPRLPYLRLSPEAPALLRFAADASDATTPADAPESAFYLFAVLEREEAFVLWGSPDVGKYAVIGPNAMGPGSPGFSLRPKRLEVGQKLEFDFVIKRFDKPRDRYRDVLGWYLRSAFSSDPLVRDLFPWDGVRRARTFPAGNLGHGLGRLSPPDPDGTKMLEDMRARHVGPIWFQGWGPWDESYATEGDWFSEWWSHFSAEQVRDEIAWEKANGLSPLLYCRQFLTEQGVHDDRPPLRSWLGRDENGNRQAWMDNGVPEHAASVLGFKVLQQSCADFGNRGYLDWYEGRIKACLDYYRPGGIAWDMGWGAGHTWGYSPGNPRTPNGDGMLKAQADLWAWMRGRYPQMRAISNEAMGTPSQMFSDGILIEGGFASGKTELDYEAAKVFGTTLISFEYPAPYAARIVGLPTSSARYIQMRYKAVGLDTKSDRYVVYPSQEIVGKEGPAIACSHLVADGEWHVATYDMRGLPNVEEVKGMAFGMQSGAEDAHLWVDYIRFSATPDGPALEVGPRSFSPNITVADAAAFEARPGWSDSPAAEYGVRADEGALEFVVRGAHRNMSWSYYPAHRDLAQEYMKVVSLGACLGAGLRGEWTTLNAFSAQCMALPPMVGSHDVEVGREPAGVNASAWGGQGRMTLAAHNGSRIGRMVTVEVTAQALARAGVAPGAGGLSRVLDANAMPSRPGPEATFGPQGMRISARLEPGEALLWGNWGWE